MIVGRDPGGESGVRRRTEIPRNAVFRDQVFGQEGSNSGVFGGATRLRAAYPQIQAEKLSTDFQYLYMEICPQSGQPKYNIW